VGQQSDPLLDLAGGHAAEAQEKACGGRFAGGTGRAERKEADSLLLGPADDLRFAGIPGAKLENHVEPGTLSDDRGPGAEMLLDGMEQRTVLPLVDDAHASHVPHPVSLLHEPCHGSLFEERDGGEIIPVDVAVRGEQRMGKHHVAQAQGGGENFGKGPQIDDVC